MLDSVISALFEDKNRKFIYVEMVSIFNFSYTQRNLIFALTDFDFDFDFLRLFFKDGGGSKVRQ